MLNTIQPSRIRLGHIKFINCLPLSYALNQNRWNNIDLTVEVPAVLNQKVLSGELDISPVSSIVYARNSDRLLLLPDLSISADGGLESILLISKRPIDQLDGANVALTAKSATSHCLLKSILAFAYGAKPEYYVTSKLMQDGVLKEADAVLFIGDDALWNYHHRLPGYYYYDLGAEWKQATGLQMVYAVWVVRKDFADQFSEAATQVGKQLKSGFNYGLEYLAEAAATLSPEAKLQQLVYHYIQLLNYDFTENHKTALLHYYRQVHRLGLLDKVPELKFIR